MDKSLMAIGQAGAERLEALAVGLRERIPGESFCRKLVQSQYTHEEMELVKSEIASLSSRHKSSSASSSSWELRSTLLKCMHIKTLLPSSSEVVVDFAKMIALNAAQSMDVVEKRIGYLATIVLINRDDPFSLLCVNTIQRDLKAANVPGISFALIAAPHLVPKDVYASVLPAVEHRCQHPDWRVKRRALFCLVAMTTVMSRGGKKDDDDDIDDQNESVFVDSETKDRVSSILFASTCDKSFHVASAALSLLERFVRTDPVAWRQRGLHNVVKHVQTQILGRRIPRGVEVAGIPAPQAQVTNLRLLSALLSRIETERDACVDLALELFPVVKETMEKCVVNHRMTYAIVYECVVVIGVALETAKFNSNSADRGCDSSIHKSQNTSTKTVITSKATAPPSSIDPGVKIAMLDAATGCVAKFLDSPCPDVRYMGLKALKALMKVEAKSVMRFQRQIVANLAADDPTLNRAAIDVLVLTANPQNAKAILAKVVEALKGVSLSSSSSSRAMDPYYRSFLSRLVVRLAKLVPTEGNDLWYLDAMVYLMKITDNDKPGAGRETTSVNFGLTKTDINSIVEVIASRRDSITEKSEDILAKVFKHLHHGDGSNRQFYFCLSLLLRLHQTRPDVINYESLIEPIHDFAFEPGMVDALIKFDALSYFLMLLQHLVNDALKFSTRELANKRLVESILELLENDHSKSAPRCLIDQLRRCLSSTEDSYGRESCSTACDFEDSADFVSALEKYAAEASVKGDPPYLSREERQKKRVEREEKKLKEEKERVYSSLVSDDKPTWTFKGYQRKAFTEGSPSKGKHCERTDKAYREEALAAQLFQGVGGDLIIGGGGGRGAGVIRDKIVNSEIIKGISETITANFRVTGKGDRLEFSKTSTEVRSAYKFNQTVEEGLEQLSMDGPSHNGFLYPTPSDTASVPHSSESPRRPIEPSTESPLNQPNQMISKSPSTMLTKAPLVITSNVSTYDADSEFFDNAEVIGEDFFNLKRDLANTMKSCEGELTKNLSDDSLEDED